MNIFQNIFHRLCLLGTGCDMFYHDVAAAKCYFMPHNRMKNVYHLKDVLEETNLLTDTTFVLNCATPQENVIKNSNHFTNTLSGRLEDV